MITLTVPGTELQLFFSVMDMGIGPADYSSSSIGTATKIDTPSAFIERPGMYGEHGLSHSKIDGYIEYASSRPVATPAPITNYPNRMLLQGKAYGLGVGQQPYYSYTISSMAVDHWAVEINGKTITVYNAYCPLSSKTRLYTPTVYEYVLSEDPNPSAILASCTKRTVRKSTYYGTASWFLPRDFLSLKAAVLIAPFTSETTVASTLGLQWVSLEPDLLGFDVETYARRQLTRLADLPIPPIEEKQFGQLAQTASEHILATDVNVLEFLSDLRRPQEMIPKLKNLLSLRTLSSNYLTAVFGVLPTIRDVESLIGAFKRTQHSDRNGFMCAYASQNEQAWIDTDIFRTTEQRLKLAVGQEDQVFDMLCQRLESFGILPTLNNVWELVPYSFLIDWLIDVGGYLDSVDARQRLARLNIRYVTMSRKIIDTFDILPTDEMPFRGQIQRVHYYRWVSDQCPVPPLSLQLTVKDFDHWLESSALIIQRRAK